MNITAIVILYNCSIENSQTLLSLLDCQLNNINLSLNVWNNGPNPLEKRDVDLFKKKCQILNINLQVFQDTRNIALSRIYNYLIDNAQFDFFTILDHDSSLEKDFFKHIDNHRDYELIVPEVYASGWQEIYETKCFPTYLNSSKLLDKPKFSVGEIFTISSGITLSQSLIKILKKQNQAVFNNDFALYGIDTYFFYNLQRLRSMKYIGICIGKMEHSLAQNRFDKSSISEMRKLEMEYDTVLQRIYCQKKSAISTLIFLIKKLIKGEYRFEQFKKLLICYICKKHPRSNILISETNIRLN